jgi:hypothetical protein
LLGHRHRSIRRTAAGPFVFRSREHNYMISWPIHAVDPWLAVKCEFSRFTFHVFPCPLKPVLL